MNLETVVMRRNAQLVEQAVNQLLAVTSWEPWFARNIVVWRIAKRLPVLNPKTTA